jgi:hypothetical protein
MRIIDEPLGPPIWIGIAESSFDVLAERRLVK